MYSATSFQQLRSDGLATDRWNRLHPEAEPRVSYVSQVLPTGGGPVVIATDWIRTYPDLVAPWLPPTHLVLGTDGFGRSDSRSALRRFFGVDTAHIVKHSGSFSRSIRHTSRPRRWRGWRGMGGCRAPKQQRAWRSWASTRTQPIPGQCRHRYEGVTGKESGDHNSTTTAPVTLTTVVSPQLACQSVTSASGVWPCSHSGGFSRSRSQR